MTTATAKRMEWCLFCTQLFAPDDHDKCPRVCDGGEHEGFPREFGTEVRRGSSLHTTGCPRSNPSPDLPRSVPCLCASVDVEDETP